MNLRFEMNDAALDALSVDSGQKEFYARGFTGGGSLGVRVSSRGTKAFFLIYSLHGRRKRITLGRYPVLKAADAEAKAIELLRAVQSGRDPAVEQRHYRSSATVGEVSQDFIRRRARDGLADSTVAEYQRILEREILPLWGDRKFQDISSPEIVDVLEQISEERNAPIMANRTRSVLSGLFDYALDRKYVSENPLRSIPRATDESPRIQALSFDELNALWRVLNQADSLNIALFKVMLLTGQRPGDVMRMRWDALTLDRWLVGDGAYRHEIFLVPLMLRILEALRDSPLGGAEYVFESAPGRPISYIRRAFREITKPLGFSKPFSPIDLRRSMLYRLPELGIRPDVVDRVLGRKISAVDSTTATYDYTADIRHALIQWARKIAPPQPAKPIRRGGKVINLSDYRRD